MDYDEDIVSELTREECWDALRAEELGRLAYRLGDEIDIAPVNYTVDGDTLLFATAEGSKLLGVLINAAVAFEIDSAGEEDAVSVVLHGRARKLEEDEEHRAERLPLHPWVGTLKYNVVEIVPTGVSGRRVRIDRGRPR
jgi:nitroimidazol reductase NimA-like FMN-containing flavoprotein (pyridoxamine 5'-phosphate oxidase superfamily)